VARVLTGAWLTVETLARPIGDGQTDGIFPAGGLEPEPGEPAGGGGAKATYSPPYARRRVGSS
jgi:hypothetical protein